MSGTHTAYFSIAQACNVKFSSAHVLSTLKLSDITSKFCTTATFIIVDLYM